MSTTPDRQPDEHSLSLSLASRKDYITRTPICVLDPSAGPQNLGVMLAPNGNNVADLRVLCDRGATMSCNIVASPLLQGEVWTAYLHMLRPSMKYALGGTTFTVSNGAKIDNSYLSTDKKIKPLYYIPTSSEIVVYAVWSSPL